MPNIVFHNITKSYDGINDAVNNLNLNIKEGELITILGPSGCGKSSSLRMLAGLESITKGEISIDGTVINNVLAEDRNIAMVFENFALYPHLNVANNLSMPLIAKKLQKKEIAQKVNEIAKLLEISDQLKKKPNQLSGGQRQRVALARCLIKQSKIFLMDEPLGHLEAYLRLLLRTEIRRIHETEEATTVYITHDQEEAASLSDRIAVMNQGKLQQVDTLVNLLDKPHNKFVAQFIGNFPINLIKGFLLSENESYIFSAENTSSKLIIKENIKLKNTDLSNLTIGMRPEDFTIEDNIANQNTLKGEILNIELIGDKCLINLDSQLGNINILSNFSKEYKINDKIFFTPSFKFLKLFNSEGMNLNLNE